MCFFPQTPVVNYYTAHVLVLQWMEEWRGMHLCLGMGGGERGRARGGGGEGKGEKVEGQGKEGGGREEAFLNAE